MDEKINIVVLLKSLIITSIVLFSIITLIVFGPLVIILDKILSENNLDYTWMYLIFAAAILSTIAMLGVFSVQFARINAQRAKEREEIEEKRRLAKEEMDRFKIMQELKEKNSRLDKADSFARYLIEKEVVGKFGNEGNLRPRLEVIRDFMRDYMALPDNAGNLNKNENKQE